MRGILERSSGGPDKAESVMLEEHRTVGRLSVAPKRDHHLSSIPFTVHTVHLNTTRP